MNPRKAAGCTRKGELKDVHRLYPVPTYLRSMTRVESLLVLQILLATKSSILSPFVSQVGWLYIKEGARAPRHF